MAKRTVEFIDDDLDGTEGARSVEFSFRGVDYRIDLSSKNEQKLEKALDPFIAAATRVGGRSNARKRAAASTIGQAGPALADIRSWAAENGYEVSERGRIPTAVRAAYDDAH